MVTRHTKNYLLLPFNPKLKGFHYQIECKTRMTIPAMKGYLNNMARAAVVRQCELAKSGAT